MKSIETPMIVEILKSEIENLRNQIKDAQETTDKLGIIGMVGSVAWIAQVSRYKELTTDWNGYAWKDGIYVDCIQEYFDKQLGRPDDNE